MTARRGAGLRPLLAAGLLLVSASSPSTAARATSWPDLSGRWAQLQVTTAIVDLPIGGPSESRLETLVLVDIEQDDARLRLRETVCSIESEGPSSLVETKYPNAFVQALSGRVREAELDVEAGRYTYREPKSYRTSGVDLEDPARDELPSQPDDPRILDPDDDGQPGLTVEVSGFVNGRVFMVQKGWSELSGTLRSARQIEGRVRWNSDQSVVAATHKYLTFAPVSRPHPSAERHYFRMARIPAEASCDEIRERAPRIFGR